MAQMFTYGLLLIQIGTLQITEGFVRSTTDFRKSSIGDVYDPYTQTCCRHTAHPKPSRRSYQKCCGNDMYDTTCEVCCEDVVHRRKCGYACCGSDYFDINESLCCSERHVVKFPSNITQSDKDFLECCGISTLYDSRTDICSPCDGATVIPKRHRNIGCCGNGTFDLDSELCCSDVVTKRDINRTHCCGQKSYNPFDQLCCSEQIIDVDGPPEQYGGCCATTPYARYSQGCCGSQVYAVMEFGCCGGEEIFNLTSQLCCDGSVVRNKTTPTDNCCGNEIYNRKEKLCCMGNLYSLTDKTVSCCGHEVYNITNQLCCHKEASGSSWVTNRTSISHTHCCGNVSYDFYTETCCDDENSHVIQVTPPFFPYAPCCKNVTYKPEEQFCCHGDNASTLYNRTGYDECCQGLPYDTRHQICCGEEVLTRSENVTCCGGVLADLNNQICCYDYDQQKLVPIALASPFSRNNAACCGVSLYKHTEQECCGDTMIYDPTSEICCGNTVATISTNATIHCCGDEPYDSNLYVCCGGFVKEKTATDQSSCCFVD